MSRQYFANMGARYFYRVWHEFNDFLSRCLIFFSLQLLLFLVRTSFFPSSLDDWLHCHYSPLKIWFQNILIAKRLYDFIIATWLSCEQTLPAICCKRITNTGNTVNDPISGDRTVDASDKIELNRAWGLWFCLDKCCTTMWTTVFKH